MILHPYPSSTSYNNIQKPNHTKAHGRHRHRIEMISQILSTISQYPEGVAKTRLMYNCSMSWTQLRKYILTLRNNDLIVSRMATASELAENHGIKELFTITSKGLIFCKLYSSLNAQDILVWDRPVFRHHATEQSD
jgi:predicted transcriptional regulator